MVLGKGTIKRAIVRPRAKRTRSLSPYEGLESNGLMPSLERTDMDQFPLDSESAFDSALPQINIRHGELPDIDTSILNFGLSIKDADPNSVSSVGLDLRVSDEIYFANRLRTIQSIEHLRDLAKRGEISLLRPRGGKIILEPNEFGNNIYYVVSREKISLPGNLSMIVDAKSTTGRYGVMCIDRETVERDLHQPSPVIVAAQPYAIPLQLAVGEDSLVQAIFRHKDTEFMTVEEVRNKQGVEFFGNDGKPLNGNVKFTRYGAALTFHTDKVLVARPIPELPGPIELRRIGTYDVADFFETIEGGNDVEIVPRRFYLLGTRENISLGNVCGLLSRETVDTGTGLWSHFAGIFWPGYKGSITMECRSESPRIISPGDYAGFVVFDQMDTPLKEENSYGAKGVYQHQKAPQAPKQFKKV